MVVISRCYDYASIYIKLCSLQSAPSVFPPWILTQPPEADSVNKAGSASLSPVLQMGNQ